MICVSVPCELRCCVSEAVEDKSPAREIQTLQTRDKKMELFKNLHQEIDVKDVTKDDELNTLAKDVTRQERQQENDQCILRQNYIH